MQTLVFHILAFSVGFFAGVGLVTTLFFGINACKQQHVGLYIKNFFLVPYYCLLVLFSRKKAQQIKELLQNTGIEKYGLSMRIIKFFVKKSLRQDF
jgi:hypothetical protein